MSNFFPAHGHFSLTLEGRILVNRARGPWNTELVIEYAQAVAAQVQALSGQPWGVLAHVSGKPIHTPEAREKMIATLVEHARHGRCATALMFENVETESFLQVIQSSIYTAAAQPYLFTRDEAQARAWLNQQIQAGAAPK